MFPLYCILMQVTRVEKVSLREQRGHFYTLQLSGPLQSSRQHFSVRVLTYLAKKDFCSCGFFPFFSVSCSMRSRNRAVSGLEETQQTLLKQRTPERRKRADEAKLHQRRLEKGQEFTLFATIDSQALILK